MDSGKLRFESYRTEWSRNQPLEEQWQQVRQSRCTASTHAYTPLAEYFKYQQGWDVLIQCPPTFPQKWCRFFGPLPNWWFSFCIFLRKPQQMGTGPTKKTPVLFLFLFLRLHAGHHRRQVDTADGQHPAAPAPWICGAHRCVSRRNQNPSFVPVCSVSCAWVTHPESSNGRFPKWVSFPLGFPSKHPNG